MRKNNINLRVLFIMLLSIVMINTNAQTGLNFQGVARTNNNVILASQQISLRLSILQGSATGSVEYTETRKVTTNAQGLFAVVIGDVDATSTLGSFNAINWKNTPKYLKIEMDAAAGNNFMTMGTTQFQYVAYAQFAKSVDAENIVGILPVSKGGTGLSSNAALKSALSLDKINNTADADKPISTKTQAALDLILVTASDTTRFSNRINLKANASDVSIITTTLGTKLNAADTIKFTKQAYSDSSLLTKLKISDTSAMLSSRIARDTLNLSNRINLKANTTDLSLGLELKENISNKSTATDLGGVSPSDVLFPTQKAVKDYVNANASSGGVADGGITNIKLADGAVTYAKFQTIPTNSILGNTSSSTTSVQAIATTGSDNVVLSTSPTITSPTLITPNIGDATASSINNVTINGFNFKTDLPSITITGTTSLQGNNTGDNATNTKYEGLLTYGAVDLITDQAIDGKKTFLNNIVMANLLGAGSITPTTINFANGSKIGDIQNINEDNPDADGSIDLYAPDGAKWVQLNYDDINYIGLGSNRAFIEVEGKYWKFKNTGTTDLPGDLNFTDNHAINFKSTSTPTTNASITSTGPLFKIQTREVTETEYDADLNYGIELNYADRNYLELRKYMYFTNHDDDDSNKNYWSAATFGYDNFNFLISNNWSQYIWQFKDDGSTVLPGALLLTGNIETAGTLKLGSTIFTNQPATNGYVLTYNNGNAVWQAPTGTSVSDNIDASTLSGTTLNSTITGSSLTSVGVLNSATVNGKVIVGATSEVSVSAVLEASSTTQGFLPPRMTIAQRSVIASPAQGLMIYCTNCGTYGEPQYYNGSAWLNFAGIASAKATTTVTLTIGTYTYTGSAQGPNEATNTGTGTSYTYSYVGTGSTTYASSATLPTNAGTYSVTVTLAASSDGNYNSASSSAAFTIAQATPTVTPTIGTYTYSGSAQGPSEATNTGTGTSYTYSYFGTGSTTYASSATPPTNAGTYSVTVTLAPSSDGNYNSASSSAAFTIAQTIPTVTATIGTYTYTGSAQGPNEATNTGTGTSYTYSYIGTGSTTYASSATLPTNAGTYSVAVKLAASSDGNYNSSSSSAAFTIAQAIPTVTATVGTYIYSGSAQGPSEATNTGTGTTYTYSYSGTGSTTYGPSASKPIDEGNYTVIVTVSANGNYATGSSSATAFRISTNFSVGVNYQGGIIAYIFVSGDPGYDPTTPHGLIVATADQSAGIQWYNGSFTTVGSTQTEIGSGFANTNLIISKQGPTSTSYAAGLARAYKGGGYADWYLPSASELLKLYTMKVLGFGGFANKGYWSSTESPPSYYGFSALSVDLVDCFPDNFEKDAIKNVRAIRAF